MNGDLSSWALRCCPTDHVTVDHEGDLALLQLYNHLDGGHVPADIFVEDTIPLPALRLTVDERTFRGGDETAVSISDIFILPSELRGHRLYDGACIAGYVKHIRLPGEQKLRHNLPGVPIFEKDGFFAAFTGGSLQGAVLAKHAANMLETWYGVQIAMLHPYTRYVYTDYTETFFKREGLTKEQKKYVQRYIRTINLSGDVVAREIKSHKHCPIWYVVGHYRQYKSGQRSFVKPHFRGAARHLGRVLLRDRVVDIATA